MVKRYYGGIISATQLAVSTSSASGFFNTTQQMQAVTADIWPKESNAPTEVEYLVVAGGGGGGSNLGGGGGAGGFRTGSAFVGTAGSALTVTVGAGGAGGASGGSNDGTNGSNSVFSSITSIGGGGGSNGATSGELVGLSGGSGGGGGSSGASGSHVGGAGTVGQGNTGGNGYAPASDTASGGGGGAGAVGGNGGASYVGASGGAGLASSISGTSVYYAGGGGGAIFQAGTASAGGVGGGGNGSAALNGVGGNGTANTGGGGAGGNYNNAAGGNGGSGIVIIRYADTYDAALSTTGSPTITVAGGYRVYTWTQSGSITFEPAPPLVIGQAFGGGFYAGQISTAGNGVADYYLAVGPVASAQNSSKQWKTSNTTTAGTTSVIDGPTNSANMNNASHPAAEFCEGLTVGGFSDWYMPAKNELEVCYYNLKPTTTSNNTLTGTNTNAVPSRGSNYTAGTPAQTSAAAFVTSSGAEAFAVNNYWSSTENSATTAWRQYFGYGYQAVNNKDYLRHVRAIRRVAV